MDETTRRIAAAVSLIGFIVVVLGYFVVTSVFLHPSERIEWHEVVILSIRFFNNSSNPATNGTYNLYPDGEIGLWNCRTDGQETGYFKIEVWNYGKAAHVYSSIMVDLTEYDHWEGDLANDEEITWSTIVFSSGSYSYSGVSNFTVRAYDTSTSPWTITDEQTVSVECV